MSSLVLQFSSTAGHRRPTNSFQNSLIYVIKLKSSSQTFPAKTVFPDEINDPDIS